MKLLVINGPQRRTAFMLIAVANARMKAAGLHTSAKQMRMRAMRAKGYDTVLAVVQEYVVFRG